MDDADFDTFGRAFRRVAGVFRLRVKPDALEELLTTYFRVLKHVRLDAVLAGGKICLAKYKYFPKPVEWLEAIPKNPTSSTPPADRRVMDANEASEYAEAQRLHYERDACSCRECLQAGISQKPLRFVPTLDREGEEERALDPNTNRVVIAGHWAHGEELARWYQAREQFFASGRTLTPRIRQMLPLTLREREPGEEG